MSWLTDWADKAEHFLNTIDKSASDALHKSQENVNVYKNGKSDPYVIKEFDSFNDGNFAPTNVSDSIKSLPLKSFNKNKSSINPDEKLFQFCDPQTKIKKDDDYTVPNVYESSDKGSSGYRTNNDELDNSQNIQLNNNLDSNVQIENKLLRSEISSLNQEMSSLLQRNHKAEEECKRLRNQFEKISGQLRDTDKKCRQLMSEKDDLEESLKTKLNVIMSLQNELKHAQDNNLQKTGEINLVADHRNRILQLEQELLSKSEILDKLQYEKMELQTSTDDAKMKLAQHINSYVTQQSDDKRKIDFLSNQLESAKQKTEHIQQELKDYKNKATKILKMKEKIISELKGSHSETSTNVIGGNSAELGVSNPSVSCGDELQNELCDLREECDKLREEVARCRVELEHKEFDLQELDQQFHSETESLRRNVDLLEEQLDRERQMREDLDADYRQLNRENRQLQDKYVHEKADWHDELTLRDTQIQKLQNSVKDSNSSSSPLLTSSSSNGHGQFDVEHRIRCLTDALLQKQAALDSSKADCTSLQTRLEQSEMRLATLQQSNSNRSTNGNVFDRRNGINNSEFMAINIGDPLATKNCKIAVNSLDKISMWFGVFMRRYPPARLMFLLYTVLLHFWVLFVLLTYQPEIHSYPTSGSKVNQMPIVNNNLPKNT